MRNIQKLVARSALLIIYKAFIRPYLDYRYNICDEAYNASFHQKHKSTQYDACLVMTRAIKGSSIEKLWSLG